MPHNVFIQSISLLEVRFANIIRKKCISKDNKLGNITTLKRHVALYGSC